MPIIDPCKWNQATPAGCLQGWRLPRLHSPRKSSVAYTINAKAAAGPVAVTVTGPAGQSSGSGASSSIAFATALGLFTLFLLFTNYFIFPFFSSLLQLSPNVLLYKHIYLQASSPLIHCHKKLFTCSDDINPLYLLLLFSTLLPVGPSPWPPFCSWRAPPCILSQNFQLQLQPPSLSSSPPGTFSTFQFSSHSGC